MRIEPFGEPGKQWDQGNILGDLNSRRGIVNELGTRNNLHVVNASVPLAEMFSYIAELRNLSKGRANYSASAQSTMSNYQ